MVSPCCRHSDPRKRNLSSSATPLSSYEEGFTIFKKLASGRTRQMASAAAVYGCHKSSLTNTPLLQVGKRRIDFVYEGRDSIEVKMPPPRHMREAALKASRASLSPSALLQALVLLGR